jgi:DNA-binding GntR family transcriptional regulator
MDINLAPHDIDALFGRTITERIFHFVRASILSGEIKPSQRIIEKDLADLFQVSHTPVREALKMLASDNLIVITSHKESYVKRISYRELMEIYQTMIAVDEMAFKLSFNRVPQQTVEEIGRYIQDLERVAKKETVGEYLDLNERMHLRIAELSENKYLYKTREQIYSQLAFYKPLRFFMFTQSSAIDKTMEEFRSLLMALGSRDKRKIKHINRGGWIKYLPSESRWNAYQSREGSPTA